MISVFRRVVNEISLFWGLMQRRLFSHSLAIEDGTYRLARNVAN